MDIDEFLDRELQAMRKENIKEEVETEPAVSEVAPEVSEATAEISEVAAEEKDIIKNYFGLWNKVSAAKFKWDNELYEELSKTEAKAKKELERLMPVIEKRKNMIKELISKANNELENNNYESATRLFTEISNMRNTFSDFFPEEKKEVSKEIFALYEKLHDKIDSKFINDLNVSLKKVDALIRDSFSSLKLGRMEAAKKFYEDALEAYKALPNGFLTQKIELGNGLLILYKELGIHIEIKNLQQQLVEKPMESYKFKGGVDNLKLLSEIIKSKVKAQEASPALANLKEVPAEGKPHPEDKNLLNRLIARKLDRAKINVKKGLYLEAKRNLGAVLSADPENAEAKQILNAMPAEY